MPCRSFWPRWYGGGSTCAGAAMWAMYRVLDPLDCRIRRQAVLLGLAALRSGRDVLAGFLIAAAAAVKLTPAARQARRLSSNRT